MKDATKINTTGVLKQHDVCILVISCHDTFQRDGDELEELPGAATPEHL